MTATPLRALRVSDELWHTAQARARECGETVSEVVRRALLAYASGAGGPADPTSSGQAGCTLDQRFLLAQGMIMQRLGLDPAGAADYLRRRAAALGQSLDEVAREVTEVRIGA